MERLLRTLRFLLAELCLWAGVYGTYLLVRDVAMGSEDDAFAHAAQLVSLERTLGTFHEGAVQDLLAPAAPLLGAYYMVGFAPFLLVLLVWLARRDRAAYRTLRTALLVSLAIATVLYVTYPAAPPRLVEGLGIADTIGLDSRNGGSFAGVRYNPYAAMPSMHVGWSLLAGIAALSVLRARAARLLLATHPVLMLVAVTATGNHYFVDSLAGAAIALVGLALAGPRVAAALRPAWLAPSRSTAVAR